MQTSILDASGFKAYKSYLAIKQHFTSTYDYFKYNGKVRITVDNFTKRSDRFHFAKLERKHKKELVQFIVSNALKDNISWIGDLTTDEADMNYLEWKKKIESLTYVFKTEVNRIKDYMEDEKLPFDDLFKIKETSFPLIFQFLLEERISIETIAIFNKIFNFIPIFDKKMVDNPLWMDYSRKILKYAAFITVDSAQYKKILQDVFL